MRVVKTVSEMKHLVAQHRAAGKSIALVPTMGALHEGHLSLIRQAKQQCDVIVVSIYVNPTQFGPQEDLTRYPRDLESDLKTLHAFKIDEVFVPDDAEMYPEGFETFVDPGPLAAELEGAARAGHFRGVVTVVAKLLAITRPDVIFLGQKDFQQAMVIRRMIEDLNFDTRLVVCPIVREIDGLAKSSRNAYLNPSQHRAALVISRSLQEAEKLVHAGETDSKELQAIMRKQFDAEPQVTVDYIAIVEPSHLQSVSRVDAGCVALVAARVGNTRLIDNLIFGARKSNPQMLLQFALAKQSAADSSQRPPGLQTEAVRQSVESCRDCAAMTSIILPPREYLAKYIRRDYQDLNTIKVLVVGRNSPVNPENYLYRNPEGVSRFAAGICALVGVNDFEEFKKHHALTDAIRCHSMDPNVPDRAMAYCARHLKEELKIFPNLHTLVLLGDDAYRQFQRFVLQRPTNEIPSFASVLHEKGWYKEEVTIPGVIDRPLRVYYCYHPTLGYSRSPSLADELEAS
jgi:pantoate--beta-alanine ligase